MAPSSQMTGFESPGSGWMRAACSGGMPRERQSLMMRTLSSDSRSSSSTPSLASPGVASELADLARDLPDRRVAVGALLDGSPASLGEARVRPPLLGPFANFGHPFPAMSQDGVTAAPIPLVSTTRPH